MKKADIDPYFNDRYTFSFDITRVLKSIMTQ